MGNSFFKNSPMHGHDNFTWIATDFIVVAYLQNFNTGAIIGAPKSEIN